MAQVEIRRKGGSTINETLERVPVAGDYLYKGGLGRVVAVVFTPDSATDAVVFLVKDPDGKPDEMSGADFH